MATEGLNFASQVSDFVRETEQRMQAVFRESAERVIEQMQKPVASGGAMPIDTGFLRASLQVTKDAPASLGAIKPAESGSYAYTGTAASLTIAGAEIGETLFACYTANYAGFVNYGRSGRPGRQFVGLAAQRWPQIVEAVCGELQERVSGSSGGSTPGT